MDIYKKNGVPLVENTGYGSIYTPNCRVFRVLGPITSTIPINLLSKIRYSYKDKKKTQQERRQPNLITKICEVKGNCWAE